MSRNARLADIYIKIYNKRPLTMDDLTFLSKYDPECFSKTCRNLVYNLPETKQLMQPNPKEEQMAERATQEPLGVGAVSEMEQVELLLENLKKMEMDELQVQTIGTERVKDLLGSLYMEMLFPHNGREQSFQMENKDQSVFNKKV